MKVSFSPFMLRNNIASPGTVRWCGDAMQNAQDFKAFLGELGQQLIAASCDGKISSAQLVKHLDQCLKEKGIGPLDSAGTGLYRLFFKFQQPKSLNNKDFWQYLPFEEIALSHQTGPSEALWYDREVERVRASVKKALFLTDRLPSASQDDTVFERVLKNTQFTNNWLVNYLKASVPESLGREIDNLSLSPGIRANGIAIGEQQMLTLADAIKLAYIFLLTEIPVGSYDRLYTGVANSIIQNKTA